MTMERTNAKRNYNLREEIEERKLVELSPQYQNDRLKKQLKESKEKTKNLEGVLKLALLKPRKPTVKKLRELIVSPEVWDGDNWESPDENADEIEWDSDEKIKPPPLREEGIPELKRSPITKPKCPKDLKEVRGQNFSLRSPAIDKYT